MRTFYLAPVGPNAGLTSVSLGMVRAFERLGIKVGFAKPIADAWPLNDNKRSLHFAESLFHIDIPKPISVGYVEKMIGTGQMNQLLEEIVTLLSITTDTYDITIIEGLAQDADRPILASLNDEIARNLRADVVLVVPVDKRSPSEIAEQIEIALQQYGGPDHTSFVGYVLTKTHGIEDAEQLHQQIASFSKTIAAKKLLFIGAIPYEPTLMEARVSDIASQLECRVLSDANISTSRVKSYMVAARSVEFIANRLKPGVLVITPGDRDDILLATSLAVLKGIPIAGLLLTNDFEPRPTIHELCSPVLTHKIPVLLSPLTTYETSGLLDKMDNHIPMDDIERITKVVDHVADHLDGDILKIKLGQPSEKRMPPAAFRYQLIQSARIANKRIVLPEGEEPRTIKAAIICHEKGIAHCILLGNPERIQEVALAQGVTIPPDLQILDPDLIRQRYVMPMEEIRKGKGLTALQAEKQLEDKVVLGTMMIVQNEVDGLVSGAIHTTANTIRPALQLIKTAPGSTIVSSVFFMLMPDQVYVYGDCAVNPNPTSDQLADIAIQSADSAIAFGIDPRIAMISYSTGTSGIGEDVEKVKEATRMVKERRPDLIIDGPLQYDAATVMSVGMQKSPNSPVAGRANVFIFPDLNTGNTTYKAVQRSANVISVGPMLQGLKKPVNDLSRGALVDDIVYTIALTAIQAAAIENN
ncbi:phosphate acetyltransferase [uncultured Cytophaga sp.]|uniref:phosphate acetyltransferase n=1 Tax=uncultured Cytophaga sp. TaxID=160238 RepID=UPI0026306A54|nr:phosphate acetyltransferase [uncultured Cytophaga sp.]